MPRDRTPVWAGAMKLALDVLWWVILAGTGVGVAVIAVIALIGGRPLRISVPVSVAFAGAPYRIEGSDRDVRLATGSSQVSLTSDTPAVLLVLGVVIVGVALILLILRQVRQLLAGLRANKPFTAASARRVTVIGIALGGGELLRATVIFTGSWWASDHLHAAGLDFRRTFPLRIEVLVGAALLILFAQVFRRGAELQHDNDLTI